MIDLNLLIHPDLVPAEPVDELRALRGVVYCIWNRVEDKRYIGITRKSFHTRYSGCRWWERTCNPLLKADAARLGIEAFHVYVLEANVPPQDIEAIESFYIAHFNTLTPNGYNITYQTPNGEKTIADCEVTKQRMSQASLGRRHTAAFKQRMSTRMSGQGNPMYGKVIPLASRRIGAVKISGAKHPKARAVEQLDPVTGDIVGTYPCAAAAARAVGVDRGMIAKVCKHRRNVRIRGFHWRYVS